MKFTAKLRNGTAVVLVPDYVEPDQEGGPGPLAWVRDATKPDKKTGVGLVVAGSDRAARGQCITFHTQAGLTGHEIDGVAATPEEFAHALLQACNRSGQEESKPSASAAPAVQPSFSVQLRDGRMISTARLLEERGELIKTLAKILWRYSQVELELGCEAMEERRNAHKLLARVAEG
jgi:hypothetical protein